MPGPAAFCDGLRPPPRGEDFRVITDGSSCLATIAVGRVPSNAGESVASLDGVHLHFTYADQSNPADSQLVTVVGHHCEPERRVNVQPAQGIASHDAPSVFVDGEGFVYVTYNGTTNGIAGPLIRKSNQPFVPVSFGVEQSSRLYNAAEAHGFTGRDGAVYLIGHNVHTRLDVIEPNGQGGAISYRYAEGPLHVVSQDTNELDIPGCNPAATTGNRFTKGYITEGVASDGTALLLAVWGWARGGSVQSCADIRFYSEDSHEVFFAYSMDGGETWWNRQGTESRTAPNCVDAVDCSRREHGILMNDSAFVVTPTRQREKRAAYYDTETDTIYLAFAKSTWCDSGLCLWQRVTDPGALMFLRFQLGSGPVFEGKVASGDYGHISAIRRAPDGTLYIYAVSGGVFYEHASEDDGATWTRTSLGAHARMHGHASLPCAPATVVSAGAGSNAPFVYHGRTLVPEPSLPCQGLVALATLRLLRRRRVRTASPEHP